MKKVVIVGAGTAGIIAANYLSHHNFSITVIEQKKTAGRKFLVAGDGGLNLTHSEDLDVFVSKYDNEKIRNAVYEFTPKDFVEFLESIGIQTYKGSSGKIFPIKQIKPITVLKTLLSSAQESNINFLVESICVSWDKKAITISQKNSTIKVDFDYLIFACGGASWSVTGSDGKWCDLFKNKSILVQDFIASNASVILNGMKEDLYGNIIKNVKISSKGYVGRGDFRITKNGLIGKPIYAVNGGLRKSNFKSFSIDFKPQFTIVELIVISKKFKKTKDFFNQIKLSKEVYELIKLYSKKEDFSNELLRVELVKAFQPPVDGFGSLEKAISTVGGIDVSELNSDFSFKKYPNVFAIGEMVDWDAPTGGYLIQACISMGVKSARSIISQSINQSEAN